MNTLAGQLAATAARNPAAAALSDGECRVDYATLSASAERFCDRLRISGVGPGDRVALVLPNRLEAVVACYGAWLAGAILVPLNAQASRRELSAWLRHCDPALVLLEAGHAEAEAALAAVPGARVMRLPQRPDVAWPEATDCLAVDTAAVSGGTPAVILYTSGTTGAPKGVVLTHANLQANVAAVVEDIGLHADDCTVSVLPFYYSYGASVLHTHLSVGAHVVLEQNLVFPHLVVATLAREAATGFSGVASTFALLLERGVLEGLPLPHLRWLTQAGGAMSPQLVRRLRALLPDVRMHIMYGQTEATARLASVPPARLDDKPGSAGRAIGGVRLDIRDEAGTTVAAGIEGEVWASGPGIMQGYWRDPEATVRVLRDGWLRTGDIGRFDDEGYLYLAGRRSDMIKTGAHRVHPLDVEEALLEHPGIAQVAVAGIADPTLGQVVKAWIVARAPGLDANAVRGHCRSRLAPYKIPREVDFVSALPRTASGKVRRASLASPANLEATP